MTWPNKDFLVEWISARADMHPHPFYLTAWWGQKRREVLKLDHGECQHHKERGQYAPATIVHHVHELLQHPDLALTIWMGEQGESERNLISLCHACHEEAHGHRQEARAAEPLTPERW